LRTCGHEDRRHRKSEQATDHRSGDSTMTTSNDSDAAGKATAAPPVWAPPLPAREPVEPLAPSDASEPRAEMRIKAPARTTSRPKRASSTSILLVVAALVATAGIGFAVGHTTGGSTTGGSTNGGANGFPAAADASGRPNFGAGGPNGSGGPNAAGLGSGTISGTVVSSTADSLTIKTADGQQVTVALGASTAYHSQASATNTDVAVGASVVVTTSNSASATGTTTGAAPSAGTRTATDITVTGK
jgi:hypothetical protein